MFSPMFTAKEGKDTSSFNYTGFGAKKIDKPLYKYLPALKASLI